MNLKIKSFYSIPILLILTALFFLFYSFNKPDFDDMGFSCDELTTETTIVTLNFSPESYNAFNHLRHQTHYGFIPLRDLRNGYFVPSETNCDDDSYWLTVSVRSTDCTNVQWSTWSRAFTADDVLTSEGKMEIGVPSDGGFEITAWYHEIPPSSSFAQDFGTPAMFSLRQVFPDYQTLPNSGQPVFFDFEGISQRCPDVQSKVPGMDDWGSLNQYIEYNNINP